ncbi:hypothetical protein EXIGLDRAFT_734272 [Exidia glandulosa HHB12029]|nr:hypothetical protein EXIGLDRAFT_734272 [Exidia glandulosa HHB12029]
MDSPFQTLLNDLLSVIFRYAAEYTVDKVPLSCVCAHWRACALADAGWWADLYSAPDRNISLSLFELSLSRSKDAPLSIGLRSGDLGCLLLLAPHAQRIRRLALWSPLVGPPPLLAFLRPGSDLPLLENIMVMNNNKLIHTPSLGINAPKLDTLFLKGVVVHDWESMELPALRNFIYMPSIDQGSGVPVARILARLLTRYPLLTDIVIQAPSLQIEFGGALAEISDEFNYPLEVLDLWLCCSGCTMRTLRPFSRVLTRLRRLFVVATNLPPGSSLMLHDESAAQRRTLVMTLLSGGHSYTEMVIASDTRSTGIQLTNRDGSRSVTFKVAQVLVLLDWTVEWRSLQLEKLTLPIGFWNKFTVMAKRHPIMESVLHLSVYADTWADLSSSLLVLECSSIRSFEISFRHDDDDDDDDDLRMVFRLQPILNVLNNISFLSQSVQLLLPPSDSQEMDEMLETRLLRALHEKGEKRWTVVWKV